MAAAVPTRPPLSIMFMISLKWANRPSPSTTASAGPVVTRAHSWPAAASVAEMSLLNSRFVMWELPVASAAHSTARWAMLLLGGAVMLPPMGREE